MYRINIILILKLDNLQHLCILIFSSQVVVLMTVQLTHAIIRFDNEVSNISDKAFIVD